MNEDQNLTVKDPAVSVQQPEGDVSPATVSESVDDVAVVSTHTNVQVPEVLKDVMSAVETPNLSKAEEVSGVQQHPAAHASITGDLISLPDGLGTREDALSAIGGKANDWRANAGKVFERQFSRIKVLKKAA